MEILSPLPWSVTQRNGASLRRSQPNQPGGAALGVGKVRFTGKAAPGILRFQLTATTPGMPALGPEASVQVPADGSFSVTLELTAGGWYGLRAEAADGSQALAGPFGVGEVFVVAGQSLAGNHHDIRLAVTDPAGRVVAYDGAEKYWRIAHDPQPSPRFPDSGKDYWRLMQNWLLQTQFTANFTGGSIWPRVGDLLIAALHVPIAFVNVTLDSSTIAQWAPQGPLFDNLLRAANDVGDFRAILWQQGESDLKAGTGAEEWRTGFLALRDAASAALGKSSDWLVAKSTYLPTAYHKPEQEARYRAIIDELRTMDGIFAGADTDLLAGPSRSPTGRSQHLTEQGQEAAAFLWAASILNHLERRSP